MKLAMFIYNCTCRRLVQIIYMIEANKVYIYFKFLENIIENDQGKNRSVFFRYEQKVVD
jgi:hypothetical protein